MSDADMLTVDDFAQFVADVHGHPPFPWQSDLVAAVLDAGRWPDVLDVPTGMGKTSLLDIAVFVLAATARRPPGERPGRRRIFFVVDRRLVVDEAYTRATTLSGALEAAQAGPTGGVVAVVAEALSGLAADLTMYAPEASPQTPLTVTRLRGGVAADRDWAQRPDVAGIVVGTVDQIGSRLLFRGYGVSPSRTSWEAAFVGNDSLVIVDEAHLATAMTRTLRSARQREAADRAAAGASPAATVLPPPVMIRMSATVDAADDQESTFALDEERHRPDAEAWRRLSAAKRLHVVETPAQTVARTIADAALAQVRRLTQEGCPPPRVLVVCNTVDRARQVHERLKGVDAHLLIGRARPFDQRDVQGDVVRLFGLDRQDGDAAGILVATQTVEVGVNLDVDALVTESASWDAIVQRLGRLNRTGRFTERFPAAGPARAVVVHDGVVDGPVYGAARDACIAALLECGAPRVDPAAPSPEDGLDVSPSAVRQLARGPLGTAVRRAGDVPVLLRPTLDSWVCTSPVLEPDPPVAPYLHGFEAASASVTIAWRAGLIRRAVRGQRAAGEPLGEDPWDDPDSADELESDVGVSAEDLHHRQRVNALLDAVPLRADECVEVPFRAAQAWLRGEAAVPVSDLDGAGEPEERRGNTPRRRPPVAVVRRFAADGSPPEWRPLDPARLRPGDVVVAAAESGGHDRFGWAPSSSEAVVDVGDAVTFEGGRRGRLRLDGHLPDRLGIPAEAEDQVGRLASDLGVALRSDESAVVAAAGRLADAVEAVAAGGVSNAGTLRAVAHFIRGGPGGWQVVETLDPARAHVVASVGSEQRPSVLLTQLVGRSVVAADVREEDSEGVSSASPREPVSLVDHHAAVGRRSAELAVALGFDDETSDLLRRAGAWHDLGKVERRFQAMLRGGSAIEAFIADEPLAKSGMNPDERDAWRQARIDSGLPRGARHEAWSQALAAAYMAAVGTPVTVDDDLLLHLVAAHHGRARPLLPLVVDDRPQRITYVVDGVEVSVDSAATVDLGHPGRFEGLNRRYGRWGLAMLEAIVRCADTTCSAEGT